MRFLKVLIILHRTLLFLLGKVGRFILRLILLFLLIAVRDSLNLLVKVFFLSSFVNRGRQVPKVV